MICPIMSFRTGRYLEVDPEFDDAWVECMEDDCAFYVIRDCVGGGCAVKYLAELLGPR